jgi:hypothetical protein
MGLLFARVLLHLSSTMHADCVVVCPTGYSAAGFATCKLAQGLQDGWAFDDCLDFLKTKDLLPKSG